MPTPEEELLDHALEATKQFHAVMEKAGCVSVRKADWDALEGAAQSNADAAKMAEMERDELKRENAKLREALEAIASYTNFETPWNEIARRALGKKS